MASRSVLPRLRKPGSFNMESPSIVVTNRVRIGSEHLVLALCHETDEAVKRIFQRHNISAERYAVGLKDVLS